MLTVSKIIILTILVFLTLLNILILYLNRKIDITRDIRQELYNKALEQKKNILQQGVDKLQNQKQSKQKELQQKLKIWYDNRNQEINNSIKDKQKLMSIELQRLSSQVDTIKQKCNNEIKQYQQKAQKEKEQLNQEIDKLKASLSAGAAAQLRQQQKKDKMNFYKLTVSQNDLSDIQMLDNLKLSFHKPVVLSKLIWSQYFQKQMTELCNRVIGVKTACGIYKITDLITNQCYIGQSKNIAERWKEHCKCGLGIDASITNQLYNAMQKDKVWNFTFEIIELCSVEELNEKERFWIETYQSNKFGLNTQKGNK